MRISPRPIFKAIGTFLRKNDTKILKVISYSTIAIGAGLSIKGGMDANEEIRQKEAELKKKDENATLSKKEKAAIVARKVLPGGAMIIGGIVVNEFVLHALNRKLVAATTVSNYVTAKSMLDLSAEEHETECETVDGNIAFPQEFNGLDNKIEFDIYEPISAQTIHHMTIQKLILSEYLLNKLIHNEGGVYLDHIIQIMGGHRLYPSREMKYLWQTTTDMIEYGAFPLNTPWVSFKPMLDGNRLILKFSDVPQCLGNERYIEEYGRAV